MFSVFRSFKNLYYKFWGELGKENRNLLGENILLLFLFDYLIIFFIFLSVICFMRINIGVILYVNLKTWWEKEWK